MIYDTIITYYIENLSSRNELYNLIFKALRIAQDLTFFAFSDHERIQLLNMYNYLRVQGYNVAGYEFIEKFPIINLQRKDSKFESLQEAIYSISFFRYGFIYEIEGKYHIHELSQELHSKNGLMIKIYLSDSHLDEFLLLFELLFESLGITQYIILKDFGNRKDLLKSVYGDVEFLKKYNPIKNLIWSDKDRKWKNNKLFTEKFEIRVPDLIPYKITTKVNKKEGEF